MNSQRKSSWTKQKVLEHNSKRSLSPKRSDPKREGSTERVNNREESTSGRQQRRCDSEREGCETKGEEVEVGRHNSGLHDQAPSVDTDKVSSITCYYTNAQSLYHKIPELQKVIDEGSIKIVGITETGQ